MKKFICIVLLLCVLLLLLNVVSCKKNDEKAWLYTLEHKKLVRKLEWLGCEFSEETLGYAGFSDWLRGYVYYYEMNGHERGGSYTAATHQEEEMIKAAIRKYHGWDAETE